MQTVCDMTVYLINNPLPHAISAVFSVILSIPQILCYIVLIKPPHLYSTENRLQHLRLSARLHSQPTPCTAYVHV